MIKVSVIVPCYNTEKYLYESLNSIYSQTYSNIEVILINDGSTDRTEEILLDYENKYHESTKYFFINNSGPSNARNIGIKNSTGEYICFMDSDDILINDSIEKRIKILNTQSDTALVCTDSYMIMENEVSNTRLSSLVGPVFSGNVFLEMLKKNFISTQTVIMRRSVVETIGYFNESYIRSEDYEYWLRITRKYKITYINEPLAYTRVRNGSLSTNMKNDMDISLIEVYKSVFKNFELNREEHKTLKKRMNSVIYYLNLRMAKEFFIRKNIVETKNCLKKIIKIRKKIKHIIIYVLILFSPNFLFKLSDFYYSNDFNKR